MTILKGQLSWFQPLNEFGAQRFCEISINSSEKQKVAINKTLLRHFKEGAVLELHLIEMGVGARYKGVAAVRNARGEVFQAAPFSWISTPFTIAIIAFFAFLMLFDSKDFFWGGVVASVLAAWWAIPILTYLGSSIPKEPVNIQP